MSTIQISTQAQLDAALSKSTGGDTFVLAAGSYDVNLSNKTFTSPVIITSANSSNQARISYTKLNNVSNITFKGLEIGRSLSSSESPDSSYMARITGGSNITYDSVYVHGSLDDNAKNDGVGIYFSGSKNVTVTNSKFEQLARGAFFSGTSSVTVSKNTLTALRSDGLDFSSVTNVVIDGNTFKDFQRNSSDHPDAIQFWTTNTTTPSSNITIRNNVVLTGEGNGMQGIFLRDEKGGLPYQNVTIENNFIQGTNMANGIYVEGGKNVAVRNNTVVSPTDDGNPVWISLKNISGQTTSGNIADSGGQYTPAQVFNSIQMALLKTSKLGVINPANLIAAGLGYQLASAGSSTPPPSPTPTPTPTPTPITPTPTPTPTPTGSPSTPTPTPTPTPTSGTVIKSQSQLDTALATAKGGETFLLASGTYSVNLKGKAYASAVTVASADNANPATIDYMKLNSVSNLTFRSVDLGRPSGTTEHMVRIMGGSNLSFDRVHIHGSLDGNSSNDGLGFVVDGGAKNVRVTNSAFEQLAWAGSFTNVSGLTLAGNSYKDIRNARTFSMTNVSNLVQTAAAAASPTPTPTPTAVVAPTPTPTPPAVVVTPTPTPTPTSGKLISSQSQLDAALAGATGGETFLLASGDYSISLYNKSYASAVTIASADSGKPATIDYMKLSNVANLTFRSVDLGRAANTSEHMVRIMGGKNLTFDSVHVHGSLDGNSGNDGLGFVVDKNTSNLKIVNSAFEQLAWAGSFSGVNGLTLAGNTYKDIRNSKLFSMSGVSNLVQSATYATGQTVQKSAVATTSAVESFASFSPALLSETLAATEAPSTQRVARTSTAATVFTTRNVKPMADVSLTSSLTRQSYYQLTVGQ